MILTIILLFGLYDNKYACVISTVKGIDYCPVEYLVIISEDLYNSFEDWAEDQSINNEFMEKPDCIIDPVPKEGKIPFPYNQSVIITDEVKHDPQKAKELIPYRPDLFKELSNIYGNNTEIVREAVKRNGMLIQYASDECKNNKEIAILAVSSSSQKHIQNDKEVVLAAIESFDKIGGNPFQAIPIKFKLDNDVINKVNAIMKDKTIK